MLLSVKAVVDVIVLRLERTICSPLGGLAPLVGSEVVMCSISLLPTCSPRRKKTKNFLFRFFPTAANKIQMLDWSRFSSFLLLSSPLSVLLRVFSQARPRYFLSSCLINHLTLRLPFFSLRPSFSFSLCLSLSPLPLSLLRSFQPQTQSHS